ncbi:hypothetical protein ACA910_010525 [Epithemia clementina (nom. ined.)]
MIASMNGSTSGPSLSRRRGTTKRSGSNVLHSKKRLPPILRHFLLFLLFVCVAFTGVIAGMFLKMTGEEKQRHVDSLRHKVQAVPNLLRGRKFSPNTGAAVEPGNEAA